MRVAGVNDGQFTIAGAAIDARVAVIEVVNLN